jgi:hypothetical protein
MGLGGRAAMSSALSCSRIAEGELRIPAAAAGGGRPGGGEAMEGGVVV